MFWMIVLAVIALVMLVAWRHDRRRSGSLREVSGTRRAVTEGEIQSHSPSPLPGPDAPMG
ncbi:hypothetical protein EFK50_05135 [Nocardioides marmoriginsengisoli]|uniref:Uncharacterized protein n=1 Tax=Nocardioides marmoriginsengisoli TaxID=661483 RepID=A0A3N0CPE6_9ACTN|nr:hypothetical protein [Nocardioides marmoriginsengisoli]RNL65344.1 hypothetical protein EFK50_05135 [Nocardioides marmoriginsengisoli]